jgi:hypothetical protein
MSDKTFGEAVRGLTDLLFNLRRLSNAITSKAPPIARDVTSFSESN